MIRKIELVNFMSHAHTVIEPGPGLNVLIGPNNCGKSAVFVALRCAVRRIADDFMVRHDQKFCEVTLTMADGTIVGFRRRKTPTFRLNDDDGMGFSAENAAKLAEAAKLPEVTHPDGTTGQDVHFGTQKAPMFLVHESKAAVARFFGSSSDAGKLMQMRSVLRERERIDKSRAADLAAITTRRDGEIAALSDIDTVESAIAAAERDRAAILELESAVAALAGLLAELDRLHLAAALAADRSAVLASLKDPPQLEDESPLVLAAETIDRSAAECRVWSKRADALALLQPPPPELPERDLASLLATLAAATTETSRLAAVTECLRPLSPPPEAHPVAELERVLADIEREAAAIANAESKLRVFASLTPPPEAQSDEALVAMGKELRAAEDALAKHRQDLHTATAAFDACDAELRAMKDLLGECPTCGQSLVGPHHHGGDA
jgi:exonuclease SbcC